MGILSTVAMLGNFLNSFLIKILIIMNKSKKQLIINFYVIILFSIIYHYLYIINKNTYSKKNFTIYDSLYFSCVVHFTLGFSEIFPVSTQSRGVVMIHSLFFWVINLFEKLNK